MSSILKEPYQISVWEDELIPEIREYYTNKELTEGKITEEEYKNLEAKEGYYEKVIMKHFEETRGLIIGAHDMDSKYAAVNAQLKTNVNGSVTLTFTMYYKLFDEDAMDFVINPLAAALTNERKIKLHFRDKWYDMVIKNCVEDSSSYSFTYTCSDIYINELSKNGFKVELDAKLENNQGTVTEVAETILSGTDWHIAPIKEDAPTGYEGPYSDIIVQTNIEPLYRGVLNQSIEVELVNTYTPDEYADMDVEDAAVTKIDKGQTVYFFYSDINKNAVQPQILYRKDGNYLRDVNEDIITNAYNYRIVSPEVLYVDKTAAYDVPNICYSENDSSFEVYDKARGEKVIRSPKTGYDPDMDKFITVYKDKNGNIFYGYTTLESISSDLAMNYLANSDNFIGIDSGWIFDGTPSTMDDAGDGTVVGSANANSDDATFTGQIYLLNQEGFSYDTANENGAESVMVMKLEDGDDKHFYRDNYGDFYKITNIIKDEEGNKSKEETYEKIGTSKADAYEAQIEAAYERLRSQGYEDFAEMSDDDLQRAIDSALRNSRYSTRIRRAVNTGVAANRKQIENLTQGEEYIFAVSLGQYTGEDAPEYGDPIRYGAKTPTELYSFVDVSESDAVLEKVKKTAYEQAIEEVKNNPTKYLEQDEYGNITDQIYVNAYNDYVNKALTDYKERYLDSWWIFDNLSSDDTKKNWERGGKDFREAFLKYLITENTIQVELLDGAGEDGVEEGDVVPSNNPYDLDNTASFIQYIINIFETSSQTNKNIYEYLYKELQAPFFQTVWSKAYVEKLNVRKSTTSNFLWAFKKINWITCGNDGSFPSYKAVESNEYYSEINSFCSQLYIDIYNRLLDNLVEVDVDTNNDGTPDDLTFVITVPTVEQLQKMLKNVFDELVDQLGIFGSYKAARDYRLPTILDANGGEKYQQHKARWEEEGHSYAIQTTLNSEPFVSKYYYGDPYKEETLEDGTIQEIYDPSEELKYLSGYESDEVDEEENKIFINGVEQIREEIKEAFDKTCSSSYIGTDDYYSKLDTEYQKVQAEFDKNFEDKTHCCGWGFTSIYLKYKEAEYDKAAQSATYTISREEYTPTFIEDGTESPKIPIQDDNGNWIIDNTYYTSSNGAEYVAYEDNENGYYIFDKKTQKVRLFNPEIDGEKATYLPVKNNDGGAYIYDDVRQVYRKYRDWASTEYRDPKTKEFLEQIKGGVAGDIIHHEAQMFDGHLGDYKEIPTRYDMVRTFEDEDERAYLTEDITYRYKLTLQPSWKDKLKEIFDFDFDFEEESKEEYFDFIYPAGHQLDYFYETEDGFYIKETQEKKDDKFKINISEKFDEFFEDVQNWFTETGITSFFENLQSNLLKIFNIEQENNTYTYQLKTSIGKCFVWAGKQVIAFFRGEESNSLDNNPNLKDDEGEVPQTDIEKNIVTFAEKFGIPLSNIGLLSSNTSSDNEIDYLENKINLFTHSIEEQKYQIIDGTRIEGHDYNYILTSINKELLTDLKALQALKNNGRIIYVPAENVPQTLEEIETEYEIDSNETALISDTQVVYVKYRWWYWRHWGRKRYNLKEKLCVPAKNGSDEEYKVYNNIHDAVSKNYSIIEGINTPNNESVAFYLKDKVVAYRVIEDTDYSPYAYDMEADSKMDKSHVVRNDYYNYYRPYQDGDASMKLFDGHFGYWCQTYNPIQLSEEDIGKSDTWMLIGGRYIPYDIRLYNAGLRKFRRVRDTSNYSSLSEELDRLFVYCNGEYITLREYYDKNTKINHLNYEGLKVYFTPEYKYDPTNFALEIPNPVLKRYYRKFVFKLEEGVIHEAITEITKEEYENPIDLSGGEKYIELENDYLTLEINRNRKPDGYFDTTVTNNTIIEDEVKERWAYWTAKVNKSFSLTDDLLSSIGIVFEKSDDIEREEDFAFLGMQLFKYIPYHSNKREEKATKVEEGILTFKKDNDDYWILEPSEAKLTELMEDITLPKTNVDYNNNIDLELASQEFHKYLIEALEKTEYSITITSLLNSDDEQEVQYNYVLNKISLEEIKRPIIPGEAPNARDLTLTTYHIYDPELKENDVPETALFDYKGQYPEEKGYEIVYDELCQKIRSIKGKESNYFKLIQDCCDTFDCWMEVIVDHDEETGRVNYEERKVFFKDPNDPDAQIYFDKLPELPEGEKESDYTIQYMIVPKKTIRFKRFVGKENWSGFKYGVNLKHIKRTIDSNQITSRIIVKPNSNESAIDGFCTIQRADENFIKENFIYDFSYYINKGLLDYSDVIQDLYTAVGSNLGYYTKLGRLNKENDQIIIDLAAVMVELDKVKANYETAVLGRDAANEEIQKLMQTLISNYDTYGNIQLVPWEYNKSKEYEQKTSTTSPARPGVEITNSEGETYTVDIPAITTELEYPKYNETLRIYFDQMDTYMRSHINFSKQVEDYGAEKVRLEAERDRLLALEQEIIKKKKELNKLFYVKYARFIQEGSWIDEDYMDDNLYYLDALAVLRNSCSPKITYDIGVVDLYAAVEFEEDKPVLEFELGDRTYIEDVEFFGYAQNDKPYQEQIVVSEKIYLLDDASQNQIKVKNYSTQFDNLFQRAAATSQTLQFNEGSYGRASSVLNSDGTINPSILQQSVTNASLILQNSLNENVIWDNTGITVTSYSERSNVVKIVSAGILLSNDGGNSYLTAITGDGVNAAVITSGTLNIDKLMIGASSTPNFLWNKAGISAFKTNEEAIDYSTFVRLDQYGVYGIKNWSKGDIPIEKMSINDTFEPLKLEDIINNDNAIFGLTWDGFFLNTNADGGRGRVTIGTQQDIRMSVLNDTGWQDRVIIGRMADILSGEQTYGFRLVNEDGEIVMDTNLRGELYLKRKLRISSFLNETTFDQQLEYDANGNIIRQDGKEGQLINTDDRVTLGIVDVYKREDLTLANPTGLYNSAEYLTKVFSVKVNDGVGEEQFINNPYELGLISDNETFAIFDNGNLYAKNAWIEGHINATSGSFSGRIEANEGYINTLISGTIKSVVFEKEKIQTVNGGLIIAPQYTIIKYEVVESNEEEKIYKITCKEESSDGKPSNEIMPDGSLCKIGNNNNFRNENNSISGYIIYYNKPELQQESNNSDIVIGEQGTLDSFLTEEIEQLSKIVIYIKTSIDDIPFENFEEYEEIPLFCIQQRIIQNESITFKPVTTIAINGNTSSGFLPTEGLSIFEYETSENSLQMKLRTKLGKLNINGIDSTLKNTYGLYSDNVFLKGTLITSVNGKEAGVSTNGYKKRIVNNEEQNLVFWAGNEKGEPVFSVTEDGYLNATKGYFSGEIVASEIVTAKIKNSNSAAGLTFYGEGNAFEFYIEQEQNNKTSPLIYSIGDIEVLQENNLKIMNTSASNHPPVIFNVIRKTLINDDYNSDIIGIFGAKEAQNMEDFALSAIYNSETKNVELYHNGQLQLKFTNEGVKLSRDNGILGAKVRVEDAIKDNLIIGCDIFVDA